MRDAEWPVSGGSRTLSTGMFAALTLGVDLLLASSESVWWAIGAVYRSSLGAQVQEEDSSAPQRQLDIRAHSFEAHLAPTFRLGDGWELALNLGYSARNLRPNVHHLQTLSYSLAGPVVRPALRLPLGDAVALYVAPEFQLFLAVGEALARQGTQETGIGLGGELWIAVAVTQGIQLRAGYRVALASVAGTGDVGASDTEQFVTAALWGQL